jgi:exodeoxyribonuclease VII small subunit
MRMSGARRKPVDLEQSLADLEAIVERLEAGEQPLEQSLKEFERGVRLARDCESALKDAEQRVQVLLGGKLEDFGPGAAGPDDDEDGDPDADDDGR